MRQLLELLQDGGVGYVPKKKASGWVRLMFENWNSLGVLSQSWKVDRLNQLITNLQVDVVAGCETQCDWTVVPAHRQFSQLLCPGTTTVSVAANNTNESIAREQMGGTAVAAIGRLGDIVSDKGCDSTGLARWTWLKLGSGQRDKNSLWVSPMQTREIGSWSHSLGTTFPILPSEG